MMPRKLVVILLFLSGLFAAQVNGQEICYDDHTGEMYFTSLVGVSSIQFESKDPNTLQNVPFSGQFFQGSTQLIGDIFVGTTGSEVLLGVWDPTTSPISSFGTVTVSYGDGSLGETNIIACSLVPEPSGMMLLIPALAFLGLRRFK
jgi:hypothetical protein